MKKKALGQIAATGALVIPLLIGGGGEAKAATNTTPGCITAREFKRIEEGMTKQRVDRIVGSRGRLAARWNLPNGYARSYRYVPCTRYYRVPGSLAIVSFKFQAPTGRWLVIDGTAAFARHTLPPITGTI